MHMRVDGSRAIDFWPAGAFRHMDQAATYNRGKEAVDVHGHVWLRQLSIWTGHVNKDEVVARGVRHATSDEVQNIFASCIDTI